MPLRKLISSPLLWLVSALFATAALYWAGLSGGFFFDDEPNIIFNEAVHAQKLDWASLAPALHSFVASPFGRPLANLTFAFNHAVAGGLHPFGFKLFNLLLHLASGVLLYLTTASLAHQGVRGKPVSPFFPLWVSLAWLLLPINLTTVLFVSQRMAGLSAFFALAATLCYLVGRATPGWKRALFWALAIGIFWPAALLSKETALLWPLLLGLLEFGLFTREEAPRAARRLTSAALLLCVGAGMVAGAYLFLQNPDWLAFGYRLRNFTWQERLLTEGRALWYYVGLILFPRISEFGLYHDDLALSHGWLTPSTTVFAVASWLGTAFLAWRLRKSRPWFSVGITWFLVGHLIESTLLPLELVHEHRNYLPSIGILWALGSVLLSDTPPRWKTIGTSLALAFLAYSGLVTGMRASEYGDDRLRAVMEAEYHPRSARSNYEAGLTLIRYAGAGGNALGPVTVTQASYYYKTSVRVAPNFKLGYLGLIHLACYNGQAIASTWVDQLADRLAKTPIGLADSNMLQSMLAMTRMKTLCLKAGEIERIYEAAFTNPGLSRETSLKLRLELAGVALRPLGDSALARRQLAQVLILAPGGLNAAQTAEFTTLEKTLAAMEKAK
jgi:hypothetical protein